MLFRSIFSSVEPLRSASAGVSRFRRDSMRCCSALPSKSSQLRKLSKWTRGFSGELRDAMVAEHSDLLTGWPPNQHAVRRAELKRERSGSIGRFSPSTAPDFAPPSPETCVFLQEDAKGSSPLSSTRPGRITSHRAANPCKTGMFSSAAGRLVLRDREGLNCE